MIKFKTTKYKYNLYLFIFLMLFIVYFEALTLGGLLISHIWKISLLIILIFLIIKKKKSFLIFHKDSFSLLLILYAIENLFNTSMITFPLENLSYTYRLIYVPILLSFFIYYINSIDKILLILKALSIIIIFSTIPFLMGVIKPLGEGYDTEGYGYTGEGFVGIFQGPHFTSITLAFCLITLFWFTIKERNYYYLLLIGIGLFALLKTYVRTGMFMFLIGMSILFFDMKNVKVNTPTKIILISILSLFILYSYKSDSILQLRLSDKTTSDFHNDLSIFERAGSGRLVFFVSGIDIFIKSTTFEKIFGIGLEELKQRNYNNIGLGIYSHNGFLDFLLINGVIGFIINILFFWKFYFIAKELNVYRSLIWAYLFLFISFNLVQGGAYFFVNVYITLIITLSLKLNELNINTLNSKGISE